MREFQAMRSHLAKPDLKGGMSRQHLKYSTRSSLEPLLFSYFRIFIRKATLLVPTTGYFALLIVWIRQNIYITLLQVDVENSDHKQVSYKPCYVCDFTLGEGSDSSSRCIALKLPAYKYPTAVSAYSLWSIQSSCILLSLLLHLR